MIKRSLILTGLLLLFSFSLAYAQKNKSVNTNTTNVYSPAPNWVKKRPYSTSRYIGIGVASKNSSNYIMEAKKNALQDLASEIKVNVSTNSILYQVQDNNKFNENFNSLVQLSNSANIEGYNLVDSYENETNYYVYYELDRQHYLEIKQKKKQDAINKAAEYISNAKKDDLNNDFSQSLYKRLKAIAIISPYFGEDIDFSSCSDCGIKTAVDLTNIIQNQVQSIKYEIPKNLPEYKPFQSGYELIKIKATALTTNGKQKQIEIQNFPFLIKSENEQVTFNTTSTTDAESIFDISPKEISIYNQTIPVYFSPDLENVIKDDTLRTTVIPFLRRFIQIPVQRINIKITPLYLYITSIEKNSGKEMESKIIASYYINSLNNDAIKIIEDEKQADFTLEATSDTKKDINSRDLERDYKMSLSNLTLTVKLKKNSNKELLYNMQVADIYGYGESPDGAGIGAYNSQKLTQYLFESLFFIKRKIVAY